MPFLTFIDKKGLPHKCSFTTGDTILVVARKHNIDIEGACDGEMACSTCHVIIDKEWCTQLPKASSEENDMLDLISGVSNASRLGCQIKLTEELDGIEVKLP